MYFYSIYLEVEGESGIDVMSIVKKILRLLNHRGPLNVNSIVADCVREGQPLLPRCINFGKALSYIVGFFIHQITIPKLNVGLLCDVHTHSLRYSE